VAALAPEAVPPLLAQLAALQSAITARLLGVASPEASPGRDPAEDRPLTVPEVALHLQVGKAYVYDLIRRGELGALRFGKYVRVPPAALREWEARHQEKALDRGAYRVYIPSVKGRSHERRRTPAHS